MKQKELFVAVRQPIVRAGEKSLCLYNTVVSRQMPATPMYMLRKDANQHWEIHMPDPGNSLLLGPLQFIKHFHSSRLCCTLRKYEAGFWSKMEMWEAPEFTSSIDTPNLQLRAEQIPLKEIQK